MRDARPPWWIIAAALAFVGYYTLLVYCDAWRPEPVGLRFAVANARMSVTGVAEGSAAARSGLEAGDAILACQGQPIRSSFDWMAHTANVEFDRPLRLTVEREGRRLEIPLALGRVRWGDLLSQASLTRLGVRGVQAVTLVLALVVILKRPNDVVARLGSWLLGTLGVFSVVLQYRFAAVWRGLPAWLGAPLWLPFLSTQAVGAVLFTLFAVFPRVRVRSASLWAVLWTPILLAVVPDASYMFNVVYRPDRIGERPDTWLGLLIVNLAYVAAAVTALILTYRRIGDVNERRRMRVLAVGTTVGCAASGAFELAFWRSSPDLALYSTAGTSVCTLLLLVVPLTFAYAILRDRVFDIRVIIRQGIQYAVAKGFLLSLVPALVAVLAVDITLNRSQPLEHILRSRGWIYAGLAAAAVVLHRYRRRWVDALDRRFFRERFDAERLLVRVVGDIKAAGNLERVAPRVVAHVEEALHPTCAALFRIERGAGEYRVLAAAPAGAAPPPLAAGGTYAALAMVLGKPIEVPADNRGLAAHLPAKEVSRLRAAGIELIVPIASGGEILEAWLALGSKRSEEPYSKGDRALLGGIADALALLAAVPAVAPAAANTVAECPRCGSCCDSSQAECPQDGSTLVVSRVPRVLAARYRLEQRLGRGGMANVYRALDTALDRAVAVKLIREDLVGRADTAARFQLEARAAAGFAHPNVVTVHDYGVEGGAHAYLVMELLEGMTLRDALRRDTRLAPARAVHIIRGIAAAVGAAHQRQLVHRDLKPENVFLARAGDVEAAKILDFGIAKALSRPTGATQALETQAGWLVGTPQYMAPEQLRGEQVCAGWDLWAMAVIAYEMLTGRLPFAGPGQASGTIGPGAGHEAMMLAPLAASPDAWKTFFTRTLSPEPADRPMSARALLLQFEQALQVT